MSRLDLDAIESRARNASEWPLRATPITDDAFDLNWGWEAEIWTDGKPCTEDCGAEGCQQNDRVAAAQNEDLAEFFALAYRDVPVLVGQVRQLADACQAALDWINRFGEHAPIVFGGEAQLAQQLAAALAELGE